MHDSVLTDTIGLFEFCHNHRCSVCSGHPVKDRDEDDLFALYVIGVKDFTTPIFKAGHRRVFKSNPVLIPVEGRRIIHPPAIRLPHILDPALKF
jgi:hypothetical protein